MFQLNKRQLKSKWIGLIKTNDMIQDGCHILQQIERTGHQALIVGGAVRDLTLGNIPHDIDIATNAPLSTLDSIFCTYDIGRSRDFGIVGVNRGGFKFEIAQFRGDTFIEDARKRDFTINSMGITKEGDIIDHFNGTEDCHNGIINTVRLPDVTILDDITRILRAVRLSVRLGFEISHSVRQAISDNRWLLKDIPQEKVTQELMKMASETGPDFVKSIKRLDNLGVLDVILPEVTRMKECNETEIHHPEAYEFGKGRVWDHVLHAVRQNILPGVPLSNLAILFHDLGKPEVHVFEDGKHKFHDHDSVGGRIIHKLAIRLKFSKEDRESLMFPAVNHMKLFRGHEMKASKIVSIVNDPNWPLLRWVSYCDDKCRGDLFDENHFDLITNRMEEITAKCIERLGKKVKVIDGNRVQELCGITRPCKLVGDIIREVSEFVINNGIADTELIEEFVIYTHRLLTEEL